VDHALRELNNLEVFTYVPRFRGRAIRMIRRDRPFDELEIDFDTLERRKSSERDKLRQVMDFANSPGCRQQEILRYFGDKRGAPCRHCDNCRKSGPDAERTPHVAAAVDDAMREVVRIVLSGVARTKKRLFVGGGKNLIAQMLCGSSSAKVGKLGLDQLSTFGLLRHLTQPEVVDLIDGLIATGHLEQNEFEPHRPVVQLTALGSDVMRAKADLEAVPPLSPHLIAKIRGGTQPGATGEAGEASGAGTSIAEPAETLPVDSNLLAVLRRWREEVASVAKLPPHYVLPFPRALALPPRRRTQEDIQFIKKFCDIYYQNPPVTEEEIRNARIQEIYIIDVDHATVQEIDPEAYLKRALQKGIVFDYGAP